MITLTPNSSATSARGEGARDLVVVGDRDRPEARPRARSRAASRPGSRSPRSGRCACAGRRGSRAGARSGGGPRGCRAGRGGGRQLALVDLLDLVGDRAPVANRARAPCATSSRRSAGAREQALELAGERDRVAGLKQQPELAVAGELVVERQLRADRDRPGRERLADQLRRRARPARGGDEHVGAGDQRLGRGVARADDPDPVAEPLRRPAPRSRRGSRRRPPSRRPVEAPDRPQEQAQRAALLVEAEGDPQRPLARRPRRAGHQGSTA